MLSDEVCETKHPLSQVGLSKSLNRDDFCGISSYNRSCGDPKVPNISS